MVIDDYDMVATSGQNPLLPLVDYLPQDATSVCTWWSRVARVVPDARCTNRSSDACGSCRLRV
ncbi:hypothetical protein NJ76_15720 [Rhodococcus sp. IITR03]|nr:hypothetical protein NJ76_15720 [Rhodococcus sp. IITR03]